MALEDDLKKSKIKVPSRIPAEDLVILQFEIPKDVQTSYIKELKKTNFEHFRQVYDRTNEKPDLELEGMISAIQTTYRELTTRDRWEDVLFLYKV